MKNRSGTQYGRYEGRMAHRHYYEKYKGVIPEGLVVHHTCNQSICVNPDHLEAISQRENVMKGVGITAFNARKTHCKHGHVFNKLNTIHRMSKYGHAGRGCRQCKLKSMKKWRDKNKVVQNPVDIAP